MDIDGWSGQYFWIDSWWPLLDMAMYFLLSATTYISHLMQTLKTPVQPPDSHTHMPTHTPTHTPTASNSQGGGSGQNTGRVNVISRSNKRPSNITDYMHPVKVSCL